MVSVASGGTADRIAARILFKVLRAGSETPARYSSTFFGAPLPFAAELRLPDFTFFMRAMLQELPLQVHTPEIEGLLGTIVKEINGAQNRVRYTMNGFVIAVGTYVKPLLKQAKASARQIGAVSVDLGDTACNVRLATACIEKIETFGRVGQKRKTIRC